MGEITPTFSSAKAKLTTILGIFKLIGLNFVSCITFYAAISYAKSVTFLKLMN